MLERWTIDNDSVMTEYSRYCIDPSAFRTDIDTILSMYPEYCKMMETIELENLWIEDLVREADFLATQGDDR